MRTETYLAGARFVERLQRSPLIASVKDDGGDIILVEMASGQRVSFHIIESEIPVYEIRHTLRKNSETGVYTLFILWADVLLPRDGQLYTPDETMRALLALYDGRIYAWELYGPEVLIFPVYFEGEAGARLVRHGELVNLADLICDTVYTEAPFIRGYWSVAGFAKHDERAQFNGGRERQETTGRVSLEVYYAVLGVSLDASPQAIKQAYRRLAIRYHPDINPSPEATVQMQRLNEAYRRIMESMGK